MEAIEAVSESAVVKPRPVRSNADWNKAQYAVYAAVLAASISIWLIAIRAPLFLDETGSYWQISAGFSKIWSRKEILFPANPYIVWLATKILGTSEIALRIPSILAMLGAGYLLYLAARELFERDLAIVATVIFCLHPTLIFESIDVRPYAFGVLTANAAILVMLRLRKNDSSWMAALFGVLAAFIVYFHYLFAVILPALVLCFFVVKAGDRKTLWRQFGVAALAFGAAFLPLIPGLRFLFHTSGTHVFDTPPDVSYLIWMLIPLCLRYILLGSIFVAMVVTAVAKVRDAGRALESWKMVVCGSLALIPLLILFVVSVATPIHVFEARHCVVAVPGIALWWTLVISRYLSRVLRLLFCVALVATTACLYLTTPDAKHHEHTWKYALGFAEKNASVDNAPVLVCSDFPESNYATMPIESAKDSRFFAQLSYYKLTVPVVPLPRALNGEAIRVSSQFVEAAGRKHERFLALAYRPSYEILDWLAQKTSGSYDAHTLGVFDGVEVVEFVPRALDDQQR